MTALLKKEGVEGNALSVNDKKEATCKLLYLTLLGYNYSYSTPVTGLLKIPLLGPQLCFALFANTPLSEMHILGCGTINW